MSVPVGSKPADTVITALPLLSAVADDVYVPPVSVTEPVGVGLPDPPLTATVTMVDCAVVILAGDGVTVTVGTVVVVAAAQPVGWLRRTVRLPVGLTAPVAPINISG